MKHLHLGLSVNIVRSLQCVLVFHLHSSLENLTLTYHSGRKRLVRRRRWK